MQHSRVYRHLKDCTAISRTVLRSDDCALLAHLYNPESLRWLLLPWSATARRCSRTSGPADAPLIVSAEAAHVAARRHINLVNIPDYIASPPVEQVKALGLRVKNVRQIAANLRDAEKCLALTQQKGGGRHTPVYLPNVAQLKALSASSNPPSSPRPTWTHTDNKPDAIESGATAYEHQLSTYDDSSLSALEQQVYEESPLQAMLTGPQSITVNIGGRRDFEGRARPAVAPIDPAAAAMVQSLARSGLADSSTPLAMARKQVKKLPDVSDGLFGRFPEQAALYKNPFNEEKEMKKIHPMSPERRPAEAARALASSSKLVERADDKTAVAFAATSLPARYATVLRILEELKFRDKRWHPTTVLDFSSGPGCGMWATMQVWSCVKHMTAVEPRSAMVRMGVCIQDTLATEAAATHNADPSSGEPPFIVPSIRWLRNLPPASSRAPHERDAAGRPPPPSAATQHSLVISTHALTRLPTHAERMQVVRDLWNRVEAGGSLVIVEPGSPVGSAFVRQAREQVLREEAKRQAQMDVAVSALVRLLPPPLKNYPTWDLLATIESSSSAPAANASQVTAGTSPPQGQTASGTTCDTIVESSSQSDSSLQNAWENVLQNHADCIPELQKAAARLRWLQAHCKGAHVVAPCAHDGVCPMDTPGLDSWCHFSQRLERRYLHRQCRYRKGIKNGPKNWEYERYSYVVLRRAPRPPPPRDVYIAPAFRQYEEDALAYVAVPPVLAHAAQAGADAALDPLEVFPFFKDGAAARAARADAESSSEEASVNMHTDAEGREEERADAEEDLKGLREAARGSVALKGTEASEVEDSVEKAARAEATEFLDSYLTALINDESTPARGALQSLRMRMEDAGVLLTTSESSDTQSSSDSSTVFVLGQQNNDTLFSGNSLHDSHVPEREDHQDEKHDNGVVGSGSTPEVRVKREVTGPGSSDTGPAMDVWGAPVAASTDSGQQVHMQHASGPSGGGTGTASEPFMHLGTPQDAFLADDEQQRLGMTARAASEADDGAFGRVRELGEEDESLMLRGRDWAKEDPEGVALSRESCSAWSRIVRKPLKRGKHVVLDLCVASRDQRSGQLERHIVAHSDRRKAWLGPAAYRLARHAKWGDLWPSIYHKNPRVRGWQ